MERIREPGEPSDEEKAVLHRQMFAAGDLNEAMMSGVALEALERGDVELFLGVTNVLRQSEDPQILDRTSALLNTYADMAAGISPEDPRPTV
jgi:hypothetical protein